MIGLAYVKYFANNTAHICHTRKIAFVYRILQVQNRGITIAIGIASSPKHTNDSCD